MMRFLLAFLCLVLPARAVDVWFSFEDPAGVLQTNRPVYIYPTPEQVTNGTRLVTRDRISTNSAAGNVVVSNLLAGGFRSELSGKWGTTTNFYNFPNTNGLVYASSYVTVSTNLAGGLRAYSQQSVDGKLNTLSNALIAEMSNISGPTNGVTAAQAAAIANAVIQTNAPSYTNAATLFVDPNGNDTTAVKGLRERPWQHINYALSNAVAGDTVFIQPGNYTNANALDIPHRVNLVGSGPEVTVLWSSNIVDCCVVPGSTSLVSNIKIAMARRDQYQFPFGSIGSQKAFTNAVVRNVVLDGETDGWSFNQTEYMSCDVYDSQCFSKWDCVISGTAPPAGNVNSVFRFFNCRFEVDQTSYTHEDVGTFRIGAISTSLFLDGRLEFHGCYGLLTNVAEAHICNTNTTTGSVLLDNSHFDLYGQVGNLSGSLVEPIELLKGPTVTFVNASSSSNGVYAARNQNELKAVKFTGSGAGLTAIPTNAIDSTFVAWVNSKTGSATNGLATTQYVDNATNNYVVSTNKLDATAYAWINSKGSGITALDATNAAMGVMAWTNPVTQTQFAAALTNMETRGLQLSNSVTLYANGGAKSIELDNVDGVISAGSFTGTSPGAFNGDGSALTGIATNGIDSTFYAWINSKGTGTGSGLTNGSDASFSSVTVTNTGTNWFGASYFTNGIYGNGAGLTNLTYRMITNAAGAGTMAVGKVTITNLTGDITLAGFTGLETDHAQSAVLFAIPDSSTRKVTIPANCYSTDGARDYYVTNGTRRVFQFTIYAGAWTNCACVPSY